MPDARAARAIKVSTSLIYQRARGKWAPRIAAIEEAEDDC